MHLYSTRTYRSTHTGRSEESLFWRDSNDISNFFRAVQPWGRELLQLRRKYYPETFHEPCRRVSTGAGGDF